MNDKIPNPGYETRYVDLNSERREDKIPQIDTRVVDRQKFLSDLEEQVQRTLISKLEQKPIAINSMELADAVGEITLSILFAVQKEQVTLEEGKQMLKGIIDKINF